MPIADGDEVAVANFEKYDSMAPLTAGGQFRTKMYMAASNIDWMAPTSMILGSDKTTLMASCMLGFESASSIDFAPSSSPPPPPAMFSLHIKEARSPPNTRNATDSSNGPVGPRDEAAAASAI